MKHVGLWVVVAVFASAWGGCSDGAGGGSTGSGGGGPSKKRIFVTSKTVTGKLGSLAAGDAICEDAAKSASLGGSWKAWLSGTADDAIDRLDDVGPWYLVDEKTLVFTDKKAMVAGHEPRVPIDRDEHGMSVAPYFVFTSTAYNGMLDSAACCVDNLKTLECRAGTEWANADESTGVGCTDLVNPVGEKSPFNWTNCNTIGCNAKARLYCFEQ